MEERLVICNEDDDGGQAKAIASVSPVHIDAMQCTKDYTVQNGGEPQYTLELFERVRPDDSQCAWRFLWLQLHL